MKAKALYMVSLDGKNYKKGEIYDIEKQVTIAGRDYFELLEEVKTETSNKKNKKNKKESEVIPEVETKTEETPEVVESTEGENFENLEK